MIAAPSQRQRRRGDVVVAIVETVVQILLRPVLCALCSGDKRQLSMLAHKSITASHEHTGFISTQLFWDTLRAWKHWCSALASASPCRSPSCRFCSVSQLWKRLIWAPLAEEERTRCCLINGGKKLNDSQHEGEREQSDGSPQELL